MPLAPLVEPFLPEEQDRITRDQEMSSVSEAPADGKAELLLRAAQQLGDVERELLMVHGFDAAGGFARLLSAEVARRQDGRQVVNEVRPRRRGLELRPGRARGWDAESWPWAREAPAAGAPLPLLLPWSDEARRLRWDGRSFVP